MNPEVWSDLHEQNLKELSRAVFSMNFPGDSNATVEEAVPGQ